MKLTASKALLVAMVAAGSLGASSAQAFKPKTHVWIGQQVLNDVLPDGKITIKGREYAVSSEALQALKQYPHEYRMGHIGPDALPDVVVGQMTVHPGVSGGKQTDDWLKFVLSGTQARDRALALGYIGHAAGDIFAHTYVNGYAGDVFTLTDGEQAVEMRHFALETFIEQFTPDLADEAGKPLGAYSDAIASPEGFVRDRLILHPEASHEYRKAPSATPHLLAMRGAIGALDEFSGQLDAFDIELRKALDLTTALKLKLLEESKGLRDELDPLKLQYEQAKLAIDGVDKLIDAQTKALDAATKGLAEVDKKMARLEGEVQALTKEAQGVGQRLIEARKTILGVPPRVTQRVCKKVKDKVCKKIGGAKCIFNPAACLSCTVVKKTVCDDQSVVNKAWEELTGIMASLEREQLKLAKLVTDKNVELASLVSRKGPLQAARVAAEAEKAKLEAMRLEKLKPALDSAYQRYVVVRDRLEAKLKEIVKVEGDLTKLSAFLTVKFNPLKAVVDLWKRDMNRAVLEYAKTSFQVTQELLRPDGKPLRPIRDWKDCWMPVFLGVPSPVSRAGCFAQRLVEDLGGKVNDLHDSLMKELGIFGWLVAPSEKLKEVAYKKLKKDLEALARTIASFVLGKEMTAMLELLAKGVDEAKLNDLFAQDNSGKGLLLIPDVARRVRVDMGATTSARFHPDRFSALKNAVTLAKLTLLDAPTLNQVVEDLAGSDATRYGSHLFQDDGSGFNILFGAVRSIDGNHQWMQFSPPYLRRNVSDYGGAATPEYGRAFPEGFRLWQDTKVRQKVFVEVFQGPLNPGMLDLYPPSYPYTCSSADPFGIRSRFVLPAVP